MDSIHIKDAEREEILRKNLAACRAYLNLLNLQRRQVLNDYLDLKGNIRVFCRIRPSLPHENGRKQSAIVSDDNKVVLKIEKKRKRYNFDQVFQPCSTQEQVFSEVEPVIKSAVDGYNICIFAYGQTGTGKTFTMEGRSDCPGVGPRVMSILFDQAKSVNCKLTFGFSMLEIYMGRLRDLLVPHKAKSLVQTTPRLSIQMDHGGGIEIENLVEIKISDFEHVKRLYRLGSRLRSTASTMSNATSSRSHCLIRISITSDSTERHREKNKIWMVDLGGSERLLKTQAKGKRLEEGKAINLSLSALGDVISSLHSKKSHVPYRNSKLTQVLRDSLGEDSKTLMLVHVSPNEEDLCETLCSLGFATRVRSIHLGQDEPTDMKTRKEFVMAELLQKLNQLERESQHVINDIRQLNEDMNKLNEKFKQSGENDLLNNDHPDALHPTVEDEKSSVSTSQHSRDDKGTSTNLPRFMRPTICSHQKIRTNQFPESTRKKQRVALREAVSVCAEPVMYNMEDLLHPDQGSENNMSRLDQLVWRHDADIATECSQDLSECDVKQVVFTEQQKTQCSPRTSENCQTDKVCQKKCIDADDWLHFLPNDLPNTCNSWSKRVFALPEPEQHKRFSKQIFEIMNNEIDTSKWPCMGGSDADREENDYDCRNTDFYINAGVQRISEDTLNEESSTVEVSSTDNLSGCTLSGKDAEGQQMIESSNMIQNLKHVSESGSRPSLTYEKSELGREHSVIFYQTGEAGVLLSNCKNTTELGKTFEDPFECGGSVEEHRGTSMWSTRTRRSLFKHNHAQTVIQDIAVVGEPEAVPPTVPEQANKGICQVFRQIAKILHAISLLGLESQSLACSDDFIFGLML